MINGLQGIPGSGKSYEAVVFHVLPTLKKGRRVITNLPLVVEIFGAIDSAFLDLIELRIRPRPVRGTWDAERIDENGKGNAFELFEPGTIPFVPKPAPRVFGHVWDFFTVWKHPETGQGPLFIIDECHVPLGKMRTDPQVVEWFKLHRHFNVDVLLMTQSFRDINQEISTLLAMMVIVRKGDILGTPTKYIRKVKGGYRGAVISTEERPYEPQYFALYTSHTQGNSVAESMAEDVTPLLVKFKRFTKLVWLIVIIGFVAAYFYVKHHKETAHALDFHRPAVSAHPVHRLENHSGGVHSVAAALPPAHPASAALAPLEVPDPYASKGLHMTGRIVMNGKTVYMFAVSDQNQVLGYLTDAELVEVGYVWKPLMHCAGTLYWHRKPRSVTCDAPVIEQGSSSGPVVETEPGAGGKVGRSDHAQPGGMSAGPSSASDSAAPNVQHHINRGPAQHL